MSRKKPRKKLIEDLRAAKANNFGNAATRVSQSLFTWGFIYLSVREIGIMVARHYATLEKIAGTTTHADLIGKIDVSANLNVGGAFRILAGLDTQTPYPKVLQLSVTLGTMGLIGLWVGVVYGRRQKHLRQMTIARCEGRIRTLEQNQDPRRTSSKLTYFGESNPEDNEL